MQKTLSIALVAGLSLAALAMVSPAGATTDIGLCNDELGQGSLVTGGPAAGEAGYWLNDCIRVGAASLLVTFTTKDAVFHAPVSAGCFQLGNVNNGQSKTVDLAFADGIVTANGKTCSFATNQARNGQFGVPASVLDPETGKAVVKNADGSVTIHYICGFHGAGMHGTITLNAA